ncbi:MAG: biopolymer transporter ExbD [Deltaproteobacteria bacterium]|nr:biopolymer transporter ExbD [Deltaproteobacteria bacterium]
MAAKANFQDEPITEINVVPLVDIVLVLLIIFMVTANFMAKPAIDMELPKADTAERKERNQFSLLLGEDGSIAIGEKRISDTQAPAQFRQMFEEYKSEKRATAQAEGRRLSDNQATLLAQKELTMIIEADKKVSHGRIIHFIDLARKTGIFKYAFNVDAPE